MATLLVFVLKIAEKKNVQLSDFFSKKKLCSQNKKFTDFFVTLIFFSVTNVKNLQDLSRKKKKWTNICPFFEKTKNTFEKRQLFDISHYPIVGEHVGVYLLGVWVIMSSYIMRYIINI